MIAEVIISKIKKKLLIFYQVRDFNFGSSFPLVDSVKLRHVELSNDEDIIQVNI